MFELIYDIVFAIVSALQQWYDDKSYDPSAEKHTCDQCHKSYRVRGSLQRHKKYECGRGPTQFCQFCPHTTKYRHDLKKHMLQRHKVVDDNLDGAQNNLVY